MKKIYKIISVPLYTSLVIILIILLMEKLKLNIILILTIIIILSISVIIPFFIKKRKKVIIKLIFYNFIIIIFILRIIYINENYKKACKLIKNSKAVSGIINDYPKFKNNKLQFELKVNRIKLNNSPNYKKVKPFIILIKLKKNYNNNYNKGDVVKINKKIYFPTEKINNFEYRKYLYYKNIYGTINTQNNNITNLNHKIQAPLYIKICRLTIWKIRKAILKKLKNNLSQTAYSFILSVFFGIKTEMNKSIYNKFINTGMIHLLAISGLHIGFIGLIFFKTANIILSKSKSLIFSLFILFIYICIISPSASSMRAFIMYLLISLFFIFGINISIFIILIFTFIILCFINPYYIFDIGFQFSFLATIGIVLLANNMKEKISLKIPDKIRSIISVTIAAFLSIFMHQWTLFKKLPLFSIISSIIIVPLFGILFSILFFLILLLCITNFFIIPNIIEFIIICFLEIINILDKIPILKLPEIPTFTSYIFLPLLILFFFVIFPKIEKIQKKIKYKNFFLNLKNKYNSKSY